MAYTTSVAGTAITASWANASVRDQGVTPFTDSTARSTAITVPVDGMLSVLTTTDRVDVYNGASWSALVAPSNGALTSWTPTVTQSGNVVVTNTRSVYIRTGRCVMAWFSLAVTGSGTGANAVIIGGLPFTQAAASMLVGHGQIFDTSANLNYGGRLFGSSTTQLDFRQEGAIADPRLGVTAFTAGLAVGDGLQGFFQMEASVDG